MRHFSTFAAAIFLMLLGGIGCASSSSHEASTPLRSDASGAKPASADWAVTLDNIEACSCPLFCQCYFNARPALHEEGAPGHEHAMRYCRFNNAFRISKGHYNDTSLDGLKFWMAGDLGGDFSKGQMDWAVLHFEPSATPQQREAATAVVKAIFAVKWNSFTVGPDAAIEWSRTDDAAVGRLGGGKTAEIMLKAVRGDDGKPVVLQNVKFWGAPHNTGFVIMRSEVEAYRAGDRPFEYHQSNGFFTTIEMSAASTGAEPRASAMDIPRMLSAHSGAATCCMPQNATK